MPSVVKRLCVESILTGPPDIHSGDILKSEVENILVENVEAAKSSVSIVE